MGTGKTSLVLRFVKGQFFQHQVCSLFLMVMVVCWLYWLQSRNLDMIFLWQEPTIGAAFFTQILSLPEATLKFDIWDTAGQERYHSLAPMYYRGAAAAIVVYDITSMVTMWLVYSFANSSTFYIIHTVKLVGWTLLWIDWKCFWTTICKSDWYLSNKSICFLNHYKWLQKFY